MSSGINERTEGFPAEHVFFTFSISVFNVVAYRYKISLIKKL